MPDQTKPAVRPVSLAVGGVSASIVASMLSDRGRAPTPAGAPARLIPVCTVPRAALEALVARLVALGVVEPAPL